MGVVRTWRGRGVGSRLLDALISAATARGLRSLCLSVEPDDDARRRYERVGFQQVGEVDGSLTMLLGLARSNCPSARRGEGVQSPHAADRHTRADLGHGGASMLH